MNAPLLTLLALMAIFPLNSFAGAAGCTLNGIAVPGDPEVIEGTDSVDNIDCSTSPVRHDIYGGNGGDTLIGSAYDDFIAGGSGDDFIWGGDGDDSIDGGGSNDTIHGQGGDDTLFGGVGSAPASGVGCTLQTAFIALGSSYLTKGGSGDDTIYGGEGNDCIDAGSGEDYVEGGPGNDTLEGGNHGDVLDGGPGADYLDGGWHSDTCIGTIGIDTFVSCETEAVIPDECKPEEEFESLCTDAKDNDCDLTTDCDDPDCKTDEACIPAFCGDGTCDTGEEDSCSCAEDCGAPPPDSCSVCGDGVCNVGEDCESCSQDCASQTNGRKKNRYCCGDEIAQSNEGDGSICDFNF